MAKRQNRRLGSRWAAGRNISPDFPFGPAWLKHRILKYMGKRRLGVMKSVERCAAYRFCGTPRFAIHTDFVEAHDAGACDA